MLRYAFLYGLVLEFMTAAAIALVAVILGVRLINGTIPFEDAFLVLLLTPEFYKPLRELGASRHAGMEGKAAAERIFEILDTSRSPGAEHRAPSLPGAEVVVLRRAVLLPGDRTSRRSRARPSPSRPAHDGPGRAQRLGQEHRWWTCS